jgi:hypothetical protein
MPQARARYLAVPRFGADVRTALITSWVVLMAILVLAWIWINMRGPRRGLRNDDEPRLTTAAKHFVADMDSRARQSGPRWQAPDQERPFRLPAAFGKGTKPTK